MSARGSSKNRPAGSTYIRHNVDKQIEITERIIKIDTQGGLFEVLDESSQKSDLIA